MQIPIKIKDTGLGFGIVTIVNHWAGAIIMVSFITLCASTIGLTGELEITRWKITGTLGFLCLLLFTFRFYWRLKNYYPLPLGGQPIEVIISRSVAYGLLIAGIVLPIILWALLSARGIGFFVFGVRFPDIWSISPIGVTYLSILFWLGIMAFSLGLLLHAFGAIKQQFFLKNDAVLRLMGKKIDL